jgi:hypothetical protein
MEDHARFKQAVAKVFSCTSRETSREAEAWLTSWRKQSSAWQTADSILYDASSTDDERYMAAHTLCTKVWSQAVNFCSTGCTVSSMLAILSYACHFMCPWHARYHAVRATSRVRIDRTPVMDFCTLLHDWVAWNLPPAHS